MDLAKSHLSWRIGVSVLLLWTLDSGTHEWISVLVRIAPQRGCELVVVVHVSGGRQGPGNSRYLWIGVFQTISVPVGSAGSGGFAGGVMSVVCAKREPAAGMTISQFHSEPKMAAYSVRFT
jgi:hypothetical protein